MRDLFRKTRLPTHTIYVLAAAIIHAILRVGSQMPQIAQRSSPDRADEIRAAPNPPRASSAKNSRGSHLLRCVCFIIQRLDEVYRTHAAHRCDPLLTHQSCSVMQSESLKRVAPSGKVVQVRVPTRLEHWLW